MTDRMISVVIVGARGRMGLALLRAVMESDDMTMVGAVDRSDSPGMGHDVGRLIGVPDYGVELTDELAPPRGSIVVDFSLPAATDGNVQRCVELGVPLVLGTTGITAETRELLKRAGKQIPIVSAANFSVGITLLDQLARLAAKALGPEFDTEIVELHHRHKRDAPSGTALRLGKSIADATSRDFEQVAVRSRDTTETQRTTEEIGLSAMRGGDCAGEHTVMFLGAGERLELIHRATDRAIFARGALRAARWLADRGPGLYDMRDVLGLPRI
ncbi:MAG: 4-hydroxy-tetrahydrodipicolinate reductase [Deltaproteobacteria bacterium]|jgi:4-hydroxy-tetrahydrodipicolinate reductase|nr:4-hydroxy-tetrahydrodipicolinate reductase [Deltaproteobacteria bacterium]MBK8239128.1 4-hydroxy-tetrahydrodipicolinate reductase [Deltaproteobacteria bacterium]MBP7285752.1 4-hydroxy-tetrahydrodipicolinate reductase [Nannocystaceae bacterium]